MFLVDISLPSHLNQFQNSLTGACAGCVRFGTLLLHGQLLAISRIVVSKTLAYGTQNPCFCFGRQMSSIRFCIR